MWKAVGILVVAGSGLAAQPIREFLLDPRQPTDLPVSHEVTAVTFPGAITAIAGADMLMEDGQKAGVEMDAGVPLRFQVTLAKGSNFFLVKSLDPEATGTLLVIFDGAAYVIRLRTVAADPIASAIFTRDSDNKARRLDQPLEAAKFSPRIAFSLLDRARAFPVLVRAVPRAVEGVTLRAQARKVELPDIEITVQEVYRFAQEDALVFLLELRNKTDQPVEIVPQTFAARIGNEKFEQSIASGPRVLRPHESAEAEFAVVGMPDGSRNDLSADNAFTILVNTRRRDAAEAGTPAAIEEAEPEP